MQYDDGDGGDKDEPCQSWLSLFTWRAGRSPEWLKWRLLSVCLPGLVWFGLLLPRLLLGRSNNDDDDVQNGIQFHVNCPRRRRRPPRQLIVTPATCLLSLSPAL